nr:fibronectin type III domain-containing protein [Nakamurella aerolata]
MQASLDDAGKVATVTSASVGTYSLDYTVQDATGDPARAATGTLTVVVRGAPGKPSAPQQESVDAGAATISFSKPDENGSAIKQYTVYAAGRTWPCEPSAGSTVQCTISGLTNGEKYTFTVSASNDSGEGPKSDPSAAIVPDVAPGQPGNLAYKAGDRRLDVSWTKATTKGAPIVGYRLSITPADGGQATVSVDAAATSHQLTGLTNGQAYTVTVVAVNSVDKTSDPATVDGTPAAKPGAPSAVTIATSPRDAGASNSATATWKAADGNGDDAITYTAQRLDSDGQPAGDPVIVNPGDPLSADFAVEVGQAFSVKVTPKNSQGDGPAATSDQVLPTRFPSKLTGVTAKPTGERGKVKVSWGDPADTGLPVQSFTIAGLPASQTITDPAARQATVDAPNGQPVTPTVSVCQSGDKGEECSEPVAADPVTPYGTSGPVENLTLDPDAAPGRLVANWNAPADNGGSKVTGYLVTVPGHPTQTVQGASATITGLPDGQQVTVQVAPKNAAGTGEPRSADETPYANPGAPKLTSASGGANAITLGWSAPTMNGQTGGGYQYSLDGGGWQPLTVDGSGTSATISNMTSGTKQVRIRVVGGRAQRQDGAPSDARSVTVYNPLNTPTIQHSWPKGSGPNRIQFSWEMPGGGNGRKVTGITLSIDSTNKNFADQTFPTTETKGDSAVHDVGYGDSGSATVKVCVEGGECKTSAADNYKTGAAPAPPKSAVTPVEGAYTTYRNQWGNCANGCNFAGVKYQNLPQGRYAVTWNFRSNGPAHNPSPYYGRFGGDGTFTIDPKTTQYWTAYGFYDGAQAKVTMVNRDTGARYESDWVPWVRKR